MMKVYPNDPCPCGSGKKFKKCCMNKTDTFAGKIGGLSAYNVDGDAEFCVNQKGSVVFADESKQPVLTLSEGSVTKKVLSVGLSRTHKAMVTIQDTEGPVCYILPDRYIEWCETCVGMSMMGTNLFPSDVIFSKQGDEYYADIL